MKIPRSLRIGPHNYEVILQSNMKYDDNYQGSLNYRTQRLCIDPAIPESAKAVTFWHEVLHGIDININSHLQEDDIDNLAVALTQFLEDNFVIELDWSGIG